VTTTTKPVMTNELGKQRVGTKQWNSQVNLEK